MVSGRGNAMSVNGLSDSEGCLSCLKSVSKGIFCSQKDRSDKQKSSIPKRLTILE